MSQVDGWCILYFTQLSPKCPAPRFSDISTAWNSALCSPCRLSGATVLYLCSVSFCNRKSSLVRKLNRREIYHKNLSSLRDCCHVWLLSNARKQLPQIFLSVSDMHSKRAGPVRVIAKWPGVEVHENHI